MINILTINKSIEIAWQGMLMIFIAIAIIYLVILLLGVLQNQKNKTRK